ncbi:MAG: DUF4352 domain-containing protein [Bacillota bacterium]|nr:DUF4352 domain-containing protein [Bacillota bacterium]
MEKMKKKPNPKSLMVLLTAIILVGIAAVVANQFNSKNTKTSPSTKEISNTNKDNTKNSDPNKTSSNDNNSSSTNDKNNTNASSSESTHQINMSQSINVNNIKYRILNIADIKELNQDKTNKNAKSNLIIITLEITNLSSKSKTFESPVFKLKNKANTSSYGVNSVELAYSNKDLKELKPNAAVKRTLVFETSKKSTDDTYILQCSGGVFSNSSIEVVLK